MKGEGKKRVPNVIYNEVLSEQHPFSTVIFPTHDQVKAIETQYPDLTIEAAPDTYAQTPKAKKIQPDHPRLAYIGRLFPDKQITDLVDAFERVHRERPDAELFLKGYFSDEAYRREIRDRIHKKKLDDAIHLVAYSNDNQDILNKTTLFVSAAKSEAFGMNSLGNVVWHTSDCIRMSLLEA